MKYNSIEKKTVGSLFCNLDKDSQKVLDVFDTIVQGVQPLNSKQLRLLPQNIRQMSHELTDERFSRKSGYMNEATRLSAYTRYFMWWNLVRLTQVFSGLPKDTFSMLKDDSYCLDLGSGPLTLPIALYLARPELRSKKLNWYCVDISQNALSLGENILLSVIAKLGGEQWNVIRVKGEMGVHIKNKVDFVSSANMFNEIFWNTTKPLEELAKKHGTELFNYAKKDALWFIAEPGIPRSGRFISLLRDFFLRKNISIIAPCTHTESCPMDGRKGQKWCHFVFDGSVAPKGLQKMSTNAGLAKDRASISFVCATTNTLAERKNPSIRIVSDPITIRVGEREFKKTARYACSPWGLTLNTEQNQTFLSGQEVSVSISATAITKLPIDVKSKAKIL